MPGEYRFLVVAGRRPAPPPPSYPSPTCHHLSPPKPAINLTKIQPGFMLGSSLLKRLVHDRHRFPPAPHFLYPTPNQIICLESPYGLKALIIIIVVNDLSHFRWQVVSLNREDGENISKMILLPTNRHPAPSHQRIR